MIQTKDIAVVKEDKDSSIVTMKRSDYVTGLDTMIKDGNMKGIYNKLPTTRYTNYHNLTTFYGT